MTYRIEWRPRARKHFLALDKVIRERIGAAVDELAEIPRPPGVKPLAGAGAPGLLRIRVGDYRVIYTVDDSVLLIVVVEAGHRREIYR